MENFPDDRADLAGPPSEVGQANNALPDEFGVVGIAQAVDQDFLFQDLDFVKQFLVGGIKVSVETKKESRVRLIYCLPCGSDLFGSWLDSHNLNLRLEPKWPKTI